LIGNLMDPIRNLILEVLPYDAVPWSVQKSAAVYL